MAYQIIASRTDGSSPKCPSPDGPLFHCIDLKLTSDDPAELKDVRLVKFVLPKSFHEHCKYSQEAPDFPIKVWAPGFFDVIAQVFNIDGSEHAVEGRVQWLQGPVPRLVTFES